MPGDTRECREHALECMVLARNAKTIRHETLFVETAHTWLNLASEIDRLQALFPVELKGQALA